MKTLLVASGSGGHLIPAMTLADTLRSDGPCFILSTSRPVEKTLANGSGEWHRVELERLTPLRRWFRPSFTLSQFKAIRQIFAFLKAKQPDVVVGFGGYLSAMTILAARLQGIPTVLHEQNVLPGQANRWLSGFANAVAVSFPETQEHLIRRTQIQVTGNPIRPILREVEIEEAQARFGLERNRPVLLVMGGSQGSQAVNQLAVAMWEGASLQLRKQVQVLHLAGQSWVSQVEMGYQRLGIQAKVFPFLADIEDALAVATLAISRAGATGIAEMVDRAVPAILVPYPHAGRHQSANADWMKSIGGATVLEEAGLTPNQLLEEVTGILGNPDRLTQMRTALKSKQDTQALARLETLVRDVARSAA